MEESLISWYKHLYASRTPPKSVLDIDPHYRIYWTEIIQKMKELGFVGSEPDLRLLWDELYKKVSFISLGEEIAAPSRRTSLDLLEGIPVWRPSHV